MEKKVSSQKALGRALSQLPGFQSPKPRLEQYVTPGDVASTMLWQAQHLDDLTGRHVADLGCGTGILGIGALLLGAQELTFLDIDADAITILEDSLSQLRQSQPTHVFRGDIVSFSTPVGTVLMNPPFGIQKKHADKLFLEQAFRIAPIIWSLHDSNSTTYLTTLATKHSYTITHQITTAFRIPATMKYHTKPAKTIPTTWLRFEQAL